MIPDVQFQFIIFLLLKQLDYPLVFTDRFIPVDRGNLEYSASDSPLIPQAYNHSVQLMVRYALIHFEMKLHVQITELIAMVLRKIPHTVIDFLKISDRILCDIVYA